MSRLKISYDATGRKLRYDNTDYAGPFVYESGVLRYIITGEGRAIPNGSSYKYEYHIKDHLGNVRVAFINNNGTPQVVQTNNYYPFGMLMAERTNTITNKNPYLYNGKLKRSGNPAPAAGEMFTGEYYNWYDYGARMYDPQLGRWHVQDAYAEKYLNFSPYQYAANNPISNIDVNGDSISVTVYTTTTNPDGTTNITSAKYYYGKDSKGNYGFFDVSGKAYSGSDEFVCQLTTALSRLQQGPTGAALVNELMTSGNNVEIANRSVNKADPNGKYILWNPNKYDLGGPNQNNNDLRPPYVALGHEMAHIQDIWNGTYDNRIWRTVLTKNGIEDIPNGEIYATHIENKIRKEQGLYLRTAYAQDENGNIVPCTRILKAGTSESIYYDQNQHTTYYPVIAPQVPYSY